MHPTIRAVFGSLALALATFGVASAKDGVAQPVTSFAVATVARKGDSVVMQLSGEGEIARHDHVDCSVRSMTMPEDGQARILLGNPTTLGRRQFSGW